MALVVFVPSDASSSEVVAQLDDSGEYWFLAPFWPASSSNGNLIDLYGRDAVFAGANLKQLDGALARAAEAIARQPAEWDQDVGRKRDGTKLLNKVRRASLMALVERLRGAIARAEERGGEIHFLGD